MSNSCRVGVRFRSHLDGGLPGWRGSLAEASCSPGSLALPCAFGRGVIPFVVVFLGRWRMPPVALVGRRWGCASCSRGPLAHASCSLRPLALLCARLRGGIPYLMLFPGPLRVSPPAARRCGPTVSLKYQSCIILLDRRGSLRTYGCAQLATYDRFHKNVQQSFS